MSTKRKLLVALGVFLLVIAGLVFWLMRGVPAEHTTEQLSGKDPIIAEPKEEKIPSVRIAKPIGWAAGEAPVPAKGLTVSRFADGLAPEVGDVHLLPVRLREPELLGRGDDEVDDGAVGARLRLHELEGVADRGVHRLL